MANGTSIPGILGNSIGEAAAFAAGVAVGPLLEPILQALRNETWSQYPDRPLDPHDLAAMVAETLLDEGPAANEAALTGLAPTPFASLVGLSLTAPGSGELLNMLRRGTINSGNFTHGLRKNRFEPMWDDPIAQLAVQYIGLGDIATAIVRGAVPAPSWVPVAPPTTTDHVPRFPVTNVDPIALAGKLGYDEDMLRIMTARSGLSLAPILATQALFRGALTANDWLLAIAEGDLRTEWADTLREAARAIPSPHDYAEAQLRGFRSATDAAAGAARHGMVGDDYTLLYDIAGRAPAAHGVTTGLARGGTYDGTPQTIPEPYLAAVERLNIRPEWYSLEYANRYNYPSAFVLRTMATGGEITPGQADGILLSIGWPPWLAAKVTESWTGAVLHDPATIPETYADAIGAWSAPAAGSASKDVTSAATKLKTTTHKSYIANEISDTTATTALEAAGVSATDATAMLKLWLAERDLIRKSLTAAQIKKAVSSGATNPSTGAAWTEADAQARLLELGYNQADAETFLAE